MDFRPIERPPNASQEPVTGEQIEAMVLRLLGEGTIVRAAVELGLGMYNNTFRLELEDAQAVVLRVAPREARQYRAERHLMRAEHAGLPFLAPIAPLLPRTFGVDFTHEVLDRDFLLQSLLPGVPAPEGLARYPRPEWSHFFWQLGSIARSLHDVVGARFGPMVGETHATWSDAVTASVEDLIADHHDVGLDAAGVQRLLGAVRSRLGVLDEIEQPRLLHGDLWTVNVLIDRDADRPTITGVCDSDRLSWGDPLADWPVYLAGMRPGTERDAFWTAYGTPSRDASTVTRAVLYRGRHLAAARLELLRLDKLDELPDCDAKLADVLSELDA